MFCFYSVTVYSSSIYNTNVIQLPINLGFNWLLSMCYYVINLIHRISFPRHSSPWLCIPGLGTGFGAIISIYPGWASRPGMWIGVVALTLSPQEVLWGIEAIESSRLEAELTQGLSVCLSAQREMILQGVCSLHRDSRCQWLPLAWGLTLPSKRWSCGQCWSFGPGKGCRGYEPGLNFTLLPLMLSSALKGVQTMAAHLWLFSSGLSKHNLDRFLLVTEDEFLRFFRFKNWGNSIVRAWPSFLCNPDFSSH